MTLRRPLVSIDGSIRELPTGDTLPLLPQVVAYDDRATLRSQTPSDGALAMVKGLGLFVWEAVAEPDDDESCLATAAGCWLLQAVSWDLLTAWQLPETDNTYNVGAANGAVACSITSVGANSAVSFSGTVTGAAVGDRVLATPPARLTSTGQYVSFYAWVSAADTVTITIVNASQSNATLDSAVRASWPVTVFKS